jgi:RNA polymerase subunit RPABC4/transcription elongation factor Spt4
MSKIIWSCHNCGTVLPLWKMKCPNCQKTALSWLHLVACAAVVLPALFLLFKLL